ncbi:MAG: ABC transporter substrate-binding protein [Balneolaceae bacterium]|nr:ABC transporter substrate-binding protein [Balneolaceae bacterium]
MTLQSFPYRYLLFVVLCFVLSCNAEESPKDDISIRVSSSPDFQVRVEAEYAEGFQISYHGNYKLLKILNPFQDQTDTLQYVLKHRNTSLDTTFSNAQIIEIPVRSMIATSTTHIALTDMLNANGVIKGMVGAEYAYNPAIREGLKDEEITSFPSGEFNKEVALAMNPDLVMVSAGQSSQFDDYRVLMDSGIGIFINSEWLETTPLGKAEWVKVMGALLNKEELANKKFEKVAEEYNRLKSKVQKVSAQPLVINNLPYKGAWFVSGGDSFTAQYLKDAGADYAWFGNGSTGGLRKDFETVYEVGLRAEVWLNPGAAQSKEEILAKDERFKDFKSFKTGQIYNNNKRMGPTGGNDFWESGAVHPERLLADLIHILHPEIQPEHTFYYYQKIE